MRMVLVVAAITSSAHASPMTVTGEVTAVSSRWTADGSRIITEATVHTDAGDIVVSQFGGSVGGIAMREFPGSERLIIGMRVTVGARPSFDLSARMHNVVEGVKVLAYPPGYVRTGPTLSGSYLYWESGCVFVAMDSDGTKDVAGDAEFGVIEASIASWNNGAASCSYLQIVNEGKQEREVGRDNTNLIKFRDASWCRPASGDDAMRCHPESAAGITTATYVDDSGSSRDGAIVDADIELNAVQFSISVAGQTQGTQSCLSDLQNTLTHELGHLLGIEHTCLAPADPPRIDEEGQSVPSCGTTDPTVTEATMFNFQMCGETKKGSLEPDDIAAVCGIYPIAKDPSSCEPVGESPGCCQTSQDSRGSLLLVLLVGMALLTRFWRRRR